MKAVIASLFRLFAFPKEGRSGGNAASLLGKACVDQETDCLKAVRNASRRERREGEHCAIGRDLMGSKE